MLRNYFLGILLILCSCLFGQGPLWQWAVDAASPGNEQAWDVCTDQSGSIVFVGGSYDANLGLIFGLPFVTPAKDGFVSRYSSAGNFSWAIRLGGSGDDEVKGIITDPSGNVYVTGYFEGTADFDPALFSTYNLTAAGGSDGFIAKYTAGGSLVWATRFGGTGDDSGSRVFADANGIYITGAYQATAGFFSTNSTSSTATASQSGSNFFGARYSLAGVVQWVVSGGSNGNDEGMHVCADNNQVYFTGNYNGVMTVYNASGISGGTLAAPANTLSDVFVISTSLAGAINWLTTCASPATDNASSLTQDSLHIFIGGSFNGTVISFPSSSPSFTQAGKGGEDIFVASLSKNTGNFQWVTAQSGSGTGNEKITAMKKDQQGSLVLTGTFNSALTFSPFGGIDLSSSGNSDVFITSLDQQGNYQWAQRAGGPNAEVPYGIASGTSGAVYIAGESSIGSVFGLISFLTGAGKNVFVARTGCEGAVNNSITGSQTVCAGSTPSLFAGSLPGVGNGTFTYQWQLSANSTTWTPAPSLATLQSYTPGAAGSLLFYRRQAISGGCMYASNTITVSVDAQPSTALAGSSQTLCSPIATLSANIPASGNGNWGVVSGGATIASPAAAATTVSALQPGINIFSWTVSNGVCPVSVSTLTIQRDLPPSSAVAGPNATICSTGHTLTAGNPATGTGAWSVLSGTSTVITPSNAGTAVSGISPGINVFLWTVSNGVCPSSSATVSVTRDLPPTLSVAGASQAVCGSSVTLSANLPTVGAGTWSLISGQAFFSLNSDPFTTATGLGAGPNILEWRIANGSCAPSSSTVMIVRNLPPSVSSAGAGQTVCASSATLSANQPATGTGLWSIVSGTGNFTDANDWGSQFINMGAGTNVLAWTITSGNCAPSISTVSITRDLPPTTASAGLSQTLCSSSAILGANQPSTGVGTWSVLTGSGTFVSVSNHTTAVNGLQPGNNILEWKISNGTCAPSSSTVLIQRDVPPTTAIVSTLQPICSSTAILNGNVPITGISSWSLISGSLLFTSPNQATTNVTGIGAGSHTVAYHISNGSCPVSTATLELKRDLPPTVSNAGTSQTLCSNLATLSANQPITGMGAWSVLSGTSAVTSPTAAVTGVIGLSAGLNLFEWTITNGICPPSTSTVAIIRHLPPTTASAGASQSVCAAGATLTGNVPAIGNGSWQLVSGTGIIVSQNNYSTSLAGLGTGLNIFEWTITNGVCPPSSSTVHVWRDLPPTLANAGPGQTVCAVTATLTGNLALTGSGSWSLVSGSGNFISPATATTLVNGLGAGTNIFEWSIVNGVCPAASSTVSVIRDLPPTPANAGNSLQVCSATTTLNGNMPSIGSGTWIVISGNSTLSAAGSPTSLVSGLSAGNNLFEWQISNGSCPVSSSTVAITRDLVPGPALAGPDQVICQPGATLSATQPSAGTGVWTTSSALVSSPNLPVTGASLTVPGVHLFLWTISNGSCPPVTDTVIITRDADPDFPVAGSDQTVCANMAVLAAGIPTSGIGAWSVVSGNGSLANASNPASTVTGMEAGLNSFAWTVSNGTCPSLSDTVELFIYEPPTVASAGTDQVTCNDSIQLNGNIITTGKGSWRIADGPGTLADTSNANTTLHLPVSGITRIVRVSMNGNCPQSYDTVVVTKFEAPTKALAGPDHEICGDTAQLAGNTVTVGEGTWMVAGGGAVFSNVKDPKTKVTGLNGQTILVWKTSNGTCPDSRDTVVVSAFHVPDKAIAGPDLQICSDSILLKAERPLNGTGSWRLIEGTAAITDSALNNVVIDKIGKGLNIFRWTVRNGPCAATYDDVTINRSAPVPASNAGTDRETELVNEQLYAAYPDEGTGSWTVKEGSAHIADRYDPGTFITGLSPGRNVFIWTVRAAECPEGADEVVIYLKPFSVPNAFSPDGDGINDRFEITSISLFPSVRLTVFNRWGMVVYENKDYRNDWDGRGLNNKLLADDTYYYILETEGYRNETGYVILKKNQ